MRNSSVLTRTSKNPLSNCHSLTNRHCLPEMCIFPTNSALQLVTNIQECLSANPKVFNPITMRERPTYNVFPPRGRPPETPHTTWYSSIHLDHRGEESNAPFFVSCGASEMTGVLMQHERLNHQQET